MVLLTSLSYYYDGLYYGRQGYTSYNPNWEDYNEDFLQRTTYSWDYSPYVERYYGWRNPWN